VLTADDELPIRPRRVLVAGVGGVGKSTFARRLGSVLGIPHTEIDSHFHGENWTPRPEFLDDVRAYTSEDAWITEWQYDAARPLLAQRAELLAWLDLPFRVTFGRVLRRTVRRRLRREVLWNGNVEPPLHTFFTSRDHILRWAIATRHKHRELIPALAETHPGLLVVRLRSSREAETWLSRIGPDDGRI
jgi:adenylate kinase family enzyme